MKNFAIAIAIVFVASVAHGQKVATREALTVSLIHPLQLLQGWLRAELDSRLLGDHMGDHITRPSIDWNFVDESSREWKQTKDAMDKHKAAYDALKDTDFKDPAKGRKFFENWYNINGKLVDEYAFCAEQGNLARTTVAKEEEKFDELYKKLHELREELESCIENSGFVGFFKSIFCTIKLSISIPINTVTVPYMPLRKYLLDRTIEVAKSVEKLPCPPPILRSTEYTTLVDADHVIDTALKEK